MIFRPERYITASIFYANGDPHLGHALELVQADFAKRYFAHFTERNARLQVGMDEHGLKVFRKAEEAGVEPKQFVDQVGAVFQSLADTLQIDYDRFIRTTDADHITLAQAFWKRCEARGDIYKKTYRAWYDVKEEEFLGLADEIHDPSVFGVAPEFLELIEEENYFFAASKYKQAVVDLLEKGEYKVSPANRLTELLRFVEEKGLQDISISRSREKLPWGIPVPGDDTQVMYVWFDALTNYLTGVCQVNDGEITMNDFWPASVHIVGKDIARFHGLLWPAMLLSADLPLPLNLHVHGFVLSGGRKMSKSLGNGIDPSFIIEKYGTDALRWYLLSEIPTLDDGDFTEQRFAEIYTSTLANEYGNLVSRVVAMTRKYNEGRVPNLAPEMTDNAERAVLQEIVQEYHRMVIDVRYDDALAAVRRLMIFCNKRIDEHKPWELAKDEFKRDELMELLYELLEMIRIMTVMLLPVMPQTAERVLNDVLMGATHDLEWGGLAGDHVLTTESFILFPRIEHD